MGIKRIFLLIAITFVAVFVSAQSVWTGNAAVGESPNFLGSSSYFQAASNFFPLETILRVTNSLDGRSVDVKVVDSLEVPGIFVVLEKSAAPLIGLPFDSVLPVRVIPIAVVGRGENLDEMLQEGLRTDDTDYNLIASIPKDPAIPNATSPLELSPIEPLVLGPAQPENDDSSPIEEAEETVEEAKEIPAEVAENLEEAGDVPEEVEEIPVEVAEAPKEVVENLEEVNAVPEEVEEIPAEVVEAPEEVEENIEILPEEVQEPRIIEFVEIELAEEAHIEEAPVLDFVSEEEPVEEKPSEPKNIFFLAPSDFRPPEIDTVAKSDGVSKTVFEEKPNHIVDSELDSADSWLNQIARDDNRPYVQVGAYKALEILEKSAEELKAQTPGYPLSYAVNNNGAKRIYRLLVGPLRPAEKGAVIRTLRRSLFPDAFSYSP